MWFNSEAKKKEKHIKWEDVDTKKEQVRNTKQEQVSNTKQERNNNNKQERIMNTPQDIPEEPINGEVSWLFCF